MVSMPAVLRGSVFVVGLATAGVGTPSISERVLLERMVSVSAVWARQGDEGAQKYLIASAYSAESRMLQG